MLNRILDWAALIILIVGGIDLGIVGLFDYDLIVGIFANTPIVARIFFFFVGVAAIYMIYSLYLESRQPLPPEL